jgi:hypothetical protein
MRAYASPSKAGRYSPKCRVSCRWSLLAAWIGWVDSACRRLGRSAEFFSTQRTRSPAENLVLSRSAKSSACRSWCAEFTRSSLECTAFQSLWSSRSRDPLPSRPPSSSLRGRRDSWSLLCAAGPDNSATPWPRLWSLLQNHRNCNLVPQ